MKNKKKGDWHNNLVLILGCIAILFGLFLHTWRLSSIPVSFYYDEMDYIVTGESVARFGADLSGSWKPAQLLPMRTLNVTAELPAVFQALTQKLFGLGPSSGRYTATIFGLLSVVISVAIVYVIFESRQMVLTVAVVLLLSPWLIHISRSGYEATQALFFELSFVWGILLWQKASSTKKRMAALLLMFVSLFLGFYSYHGAKFTFMAIGVVSMGSLVLSRTKSLKLEKLLSVFFLGVLLLVLGVRTVVLNQQGVFSSREGELIFDSQKLTDQVNFARQQAIRLPLQSVFVNKATVLFDQALRHYLSVFDVYRLGINGLEGTYQFSLIVHGFFYISTIILFILGARYLLAQKNQHIYLVVILFLISPVASVVSSAYQSIFRSALTYQLVLIIAGIGLWWLLKQVQALSFHRAVIAQLIIFLVLIGEASMFGFRYFAQYPIFSADNQFFFEKLLAGYLVRTNQPATVVAERYAYSYTRSYIAYGGLMSQLTLQERAQFAHPENEQFTVKNVIIQSSCPKVIDSNALLVVESGMYKYCGYDKLENQIAPKLALSSPIDSRSYFYVLGDQVCQGQQLPSFIHAHRVADFDVMTLSNQEFCQTWMKKE